MSPRSHGSYDHGIERYGVVQTDNDVRGHPAFSPNLFPHVFLFWLLPTVEHFIEFPHILPCRQGVLRLFNENFHPPP
jgi:hypothetical protein